MDAGDLLRSFRRNAVHVRQGIAGLATPAVAAPLQVDGGYLQDASLVERYKRLSIPVRRALNPTDRAGFTQALDALKETAGVDRDARKAVEASWQRLQEELDSQIGLGGGKVPRRQILTAWLEAAAFYDKLDRDRAYDQLIEQWGKAAESIGAQLMEDTARVVVSLDDVIAEALGEPAILPPPLKTPPPPKDPKSGGGRSCSGKIGRWPGGHGFESARSQHGGCARDVEQNEWLDPAFLTQLVPASTKVTLAEGDKKEQSLRIK